MPSPEHYHYQRRPERPLPSPRLQALITDLAEYHEVDLTQTKTLFRFARPVQDKQWVIHTLQADKVNVASLPTEEDAFTLPDISLHFAVTPDGWQLEQLLHTGTVWQDFGDRLAEQGEAVGDPQTDFPFAAFTAYVATLIEAEAQVMKASDEPAGQDWLTSA